MSRKKTLDIKEILNGYYQSYQKDGEPISVNFRELVPELKKPERYTHLRNGVTMFATGKVTNERWTCAEEGFVLVTTTNLSATLREPSLSSER